MLQMVSDSYKKTSKLLFLSKNSVENVSLFPQKYEAARVFNTDNKKCLLST